MRKLTDLRLWLGGGIAGAALAGISANLSGVPDANPYRIVGLLIGTAVAAYLTKRFQAN